jgi:hypothetical protein
MESFEYVMALVSVIVGLGLTHLLSALGAGVHRVRGHGASLRLETTYLLWIGFVLIWLVQFWWFEFKFQQLPMVWSFGLYLFIIAYAISLFLMAVVLVPENMEGVSESYEYFMAGKRWFFGAFLLTQVIDVVDTFLKGYDWGTRPVYIVQASAFFVVCFIGLSTRRRPAQLGIAWVAFLGQLLYSFQELGVLGSW